MSYIYKDIELLKDFINEFFDYKSLKQIGLFKNISKTDYVAQANKICDYFGLNNIYEYGSKTIKAHITYVDGHKPKGSSFITEFSNIYE